MTRTLDQFQSTSSFLLRVNEKFLAELDALCRVQPEKTTRSAMIRRLVADAVECNAALRAERAQAELEREALIRELHLRTKDVPRHIVDMRIALHKRAQKGTIKQNPQHLAYVGRLPGRAK